MKILKIYLIGLLSIYSVGSCRTEADEDIVKFTVENTTDYKVGFFLYSGSSRGQGTLVYERTSDGPGVLWERDITVKLGDPLPLNVIEADVAILVFNDSIKEQHTIEMPERTMFNTLLSFTGSGNLLTYFVTEENFKNSVPCDGQCN